MKGKPGFLPQSPFQTWEAGGFLPLPWPGAIAIEHFRHAGSEARYLPLIIPYRVLSAPVKQKPQQRS